MQGSLGVRVFGLRQQHRTPFLLTELLKSAALS
jgi:hypothetical protein